MSFFSKFDKAHSRISLMLEQSFERWEITPAQFRLLDEVASLEKCSPKDLATTLEIDRAAVTRLIDRLVEKKRLIRIRCKDDRRFCYVSLHPNFLQEINQIREHQTRVEQAFLEGLTSDKRELLESVIQELSQQRKYLANEPGVSVVF